MIFNLFQNGPIDGEEDIATGTYADGAAGTPRFDLSRRPRDRRAGLRRTAHERDYGANRIPCEAGAGFVP